MAQNIDKKVVGVIVLIIVVANFFLFIFTIIPWQAFLVVLGLGYFFTKFVFPKMKKN